MPRASRAPFEGGGENVDTEIARLRDLDLQSLRMRWRTSFGQEAPAHLARSLLFSTIAYRLQAEATGDLDAETVRFLKQIELTPSKQAAVPLAQAFDQRRRTLSLGTMLTREWNGHLHQVTVCEDGFSWGARTYRSLSEIAKAITGTKWNGPRFFGLRDKKGEMP